MKLIIISGPSGSGKTTLSKLILKKLKNGFILSTDDYYRTGILSNVLSKFVNSYFDRKISFNYKLFQKDVNFIIERNKLNHLYSYDFKKKEIKKLIKKTTNINYLILEGIFVKDILKDLNNQKCLFIELKINKESCMNRVIHRDYKERGKSKILAKKNFNLSWKYYYKSNKIKFLINKTNQLIFSNKPDLDLIVERILNFKT